MIDFPRVNDSLSIQTSNSQPQVIESTSAKAKAKVEVQGHLTIKAYDRGKLVPTHCRDKSNIWLLEGRAYDAMVKSYSSYTPLTPVRNDRIRYIGFGSGTQPLVSTIQRLAIPLPFNMANDYLTTLELPTFSPDYTIVTYTKLVNTNEISLVMSQDFSEVGLFTDGIAPTYAPGTRPISLAASSAQVPVAYNTFEPIGKTTDITLIISWELRHN